MRQKAEYSDKYGCNIQFNCGGEPISKLSHGSLSNKDIDGAQPKRFTAERARPHPDLSSNQNIEGHSTEGRSRLRVPAHPRNPLTPEYNLPPLPPPPEVEAQKFIRNTLDVSDIPGSKVRVSRSLKKPDNALKTSDIEGSPTFRHGHPAGGSQSKPRDDRRMDVSDIVTKIKQPNARKEQENLVSSVEDGLGKAGSGALLKKEYFDSLRRHGSDVTRARDQAQTTLVSAVSTNFKTTSSQASVATALETQFREIDKHNSGLLKPKEFETAVQRSGLEIPKEEIQKVSKALGAASSSGMVVYQEVLTCLYDNIESNTAAPLPAAAGEVPSPATSGTANTAATNTSTTPPPWYLSRQRRIKTDVAVCMGQQPEATAASAAHVVTPQEKASRQHGATGKKIQGLIRPGETGSSGSGGDSTNGELHKKGNYWFADYQKATDTPASVTKSYHGGGSDGGGGKSELWFSKAGDDEKSMQEMAVWRPTKDADIAVCDFTKRNSKNTKSGGGGEKEGGVDCSVAGIGQQKEGNQGLPPPKPLVSKPKPTPPTRKDRQMAEKDVDRVRHLD